MTENLTLLTKYEVTSADTDMFGRLRLGSFVNFLIQSAIKSANQLGFGFVEMTEQNLFWVLSRLSMKIDKIPVCNDFVTIETWPKDVEKILYLRDYFIKNSENKIIARSTSGWFLIDINKKRPKLLDSISEERFKALNKKHGLIHIPEKLNAVKNDKSFNVKSSYFDIDLNKHVTSSRYIDWAMDTFPPEFHRDNYPSMLSVNYLKETKPNEAIMIKRSMPAENEYHFEGINLNSDSISFRIKIVF